MAVWTVMAEIDDTPGPHHRRRRWVRTLVVAGVAVAGLGVLVWTMQRSLIYFPDRSPVPAAGDVIAGAEDIVLSTSDGLELGAWFVPPSGEDRGMAVLVAPGNGGNREGRAGLAEELATRGFAVLLMDYRGYGGNPGSPTEDGLHRDAVAALQWLEIEGYPVDATILFGESLGTGVVAGLLESYESAGVVLRSPFTELADVGRHHYPWLPIQTMLRDRYPVMEPISRTQTPVTVIRGERDSVVPTELSAQVADAASALVEGMVLPDADHNDAVMVGPEVADAVARMADAVQGRTLG